ncbi:MAG TPA: GerMN domain-containing protein [Thermoanaerobaculia bacterium]|nr:GerMN domain-containing protein [Thermoanaerobaculia bacterium]
MSRRAAGAILGLALVVLTVGVTWWLLSDRGSRPWRRGPQEEAAQPREKVSFELYFPAGPSGNAMLRGERRELEVTESPRDRVRKIVEALLAGPRQPGLARPFPEQVQLGSVQLVPGASEETGNIAYVDLRWAEQAEPPAGGSTEEIQRIYSVVDSVALNVPEVQGVVLLWNGTQRATFSGHLDTSLPLPPDRTLVAPAGAAAPAQPAPSPQAAPTPTPATPAGQPAQ